MTCRVFTYGTLMHGEGNSGLLASAAFVGTAHTKPDYTMLHLGGFPAIVPAQNDRGVSVVGEVYEVDADTLQSLDWLEGVPSLYTRETITLTDGARVFVYVLNPDRAHGQPVIQSGDWRKAA